MRSFLKWAGGKQRLCQRIRAVLPPAERLIEPFAGSATLFANTDYPRYYLADINPDLMRCYHLLKTTPQPLIEQTRTLFSQQTNCAKTYYQYREEFNATHADDSTPVAIHIRKSALFIYLNRHGFNGLCRYNKSGRFNVPFGRYDQPYFPDKEMRYYATKLQHAELGNTSFSKSMQQAKPGDVIYCDPPYIPLSNTASFTEYAANRFALEQQEELAQLAHQLSQRGIPVIISNHQSPIATRLYANATIHHFPVQRNISCKATHRQPVDEILAVFK